MIKKQTFRLILILIILLSSFYVGYSIIERNYQNTILSQHYNEDVNRNTLKAGFSIVEDEYQIKFSSAKEIETQFLDTQKQKGVIKGTYSYRGGGNKIPQFTMFVTQIINENTKEFFIINLKKRDGGGTSDIRIKKYNIQR